MRRSFLAISVFFLAAPSLAEARPDSLRMSCAAASALVRQSGAVVIGTGPNIYERFVTDVGKCSRTQTSEPAWIPTADQKQCLVGRRCVERRIRYRH